MKTMMVQTEPNQADAQAGPAATFQMSEPADMDVDIFEKKAKTPNLGAENSPESSRSRLISDPSSLEKAEAAKQTRPSPTSWRNCWGGWPHWKRHPRLPIVLFILVGLLSCGLAAAFFVPIYFTGKARLERERQAQLEIERLDAANATAPRASIMPLGVGPSEATLPTPIKYRSISVPVESPTLMA